MRSVSTTSRPCPIRDELVGDYNLSYRPHVHADAVIGWAWQAFADYDFENNPLQFRRAPCAPWRAPQRIRHLYLADSIGIDFHKTGFTPYISCLVLLNDRHDFELIRSQDRCRTSTSSASTAPACTRWRPRAAAWARGGTGQFNCSAKKGCGRDWPSVEMAECCANSSRAMPPPGAQPRQLRYCDPVSGLPRRCRHVCIKDREKDDEKFRPTLLATTIITARSSNTSTAKRLPAGVWPSRLPIATGKPATASR